MSDEVFTFTDFKDFHLIPTVPPEVLGSLITKICLANKQMVDFCKLQVYNMDFHGYVMPDDSYVIFEYNFNL